jgi:hypothetical protein
LNQRAVARLLSAGSGAAISKQMSRHAGEIDGIRNREVQVIEERLDEARKRRHKKSVDNLKS